MAKAPNTLRVLTWNVSSWDETNKVQRGGTSYRNKMLASIDSSQADVLCLQEFFEGKNPKYFEPTIPVLEKMGYWYHYYVPSCTWPDSTSLGIGIFSKYPIQGANQYSFGPKAYAQQLVQTDVVFKDQVIRFFTVHLQSFHLGSQDYAQLHTFKEASITHVEGSINIIQKFKYAARQRALQADMVREHINQSPYPVIVTGDFNDVPNSYTYHRIRGNLRDVFVDRGNGLGRTFHYLSPTLRIDHILIHPGFRTTQYQLFRYPYSEHNGVLADVNIFPEK